MGQVQSTFELDSESVAALSQLARRWQTPEEEVLRRVLQDAAQREKSISVKEKLFTSFRKSWQGPISIFGGKQFETGGVDCECFSD